MNNDRIYYSHDAEMHAMRERTLMTLVLLTLGLGIGAALALLFAPSSGKKTRHDFAKSVGDGMQDGRDAVEPTVQRLEEKFNELVKTVEDRLKK